MALFRILLLIVTLVTQALPVGMIRASVAEKKCTMGCCAALEEAGLGECGSGCAGDTGACNAATRSGSRDHAAARVGGIACFFDGLVHPCRHRPRTAA